MSRSKAPRVPSYRWHQSGQARITFQGRDIYLGRYNSPESYEKYHRLISEILAGAYTSIGDASDMQVGEVIARYMIFAEGRYRKHGKRTKEFSAIKAAVRPLIALYRSSLANNFDAKAMRVVRTNMINRGWTRKDINAHIGRITRIFKWGHGELGISQSVHHSLSTLPGLRKGELDVRESTPVLPVPLEIIRQTQKYLPGMVADMVSIQLLTGMRPGEVVIMRTKDIERTGAIWIYRPWRHKLEHYDIVREVEIGPRAQELIQQYISSDPDIYIFRPAESERLRHEKIRRHRKTPVQPSQQKRAERASRQHYADHYTVSSYRQAILRACKAAFPPAGKLVQQEGEGLQAWLARIEMAGLSNELKAWHDKHKWTPNQIRHTAATLVRDKYSLEISSAVLGHKHVSTTEIYAEIARRRARTAIAEIG